MTLLKQAGKLNAVDIAEDVAASLAALDPSRLNELVDFIEQGINAPALSAALGAAQLQRIKDTLEPLLKARKWAARSYLNSLFAALNTLPADGIAWSGNAAPHGTLPVTGSLTLAVGATAAASLTIKPGPVYALSGEAGIAGSLSLPFTYGSFSSSAQASVKASLEARFAHAPATRLVDALVTDLPVLESLNAPDTLRRSSMTEVVLKASGQVKLGASIAAGKSFTTDVSNNGNVVGISGGAELRYALEWARGGDYTLTIKPAAREHWLAVTLEDVSVSDLTRSLSIGANIRIKGLKDTLAPIMAQLSRYPDALEKFASDYAHPSQLLADLLKDEIPADNPVIAALLDGVFGQAPANEVAAKLRDTIVQTVDAREARWTALLAGQVNSLVASVLKDLNLPASVSSDVSQLVDDALAGASSKLQARIIEDLKKLIDGAWNAIAPRINEIEAIGHHLAADLDARAQQLFKPMLALLANYRRIEERLGDAIEASEKQGLGITYTRQVRSGKQEASLLSFELDATDAAAQALFRGMLVGDFSEAVLACQRGAPYIELKGGRYREVISYQRTVGVTINILGQQLANTRFLASEIPIETSATGAIIIADINGVLSETVKAGRVDQSIKLSSVINLVAGTAADETALTLGLTHGDGDMTAQDLAAFFGLLNAGELVPVDVTQRLLASYSSLGVLDSKGRRALRFLATLTLTRGDVAAIIEFMARPGNGDVAKDIAIRRQLAAARKPIVLSQALEFAEHRVHLDSEARGFFTQTPGAIEARIEPHPQNLHLDGRTNLEFAVHTLARIGRNADNLPAFFEKWAVLAHTSLTIIDNKVSATQVGALDAANRSMLKLLDGWVSVPGALALRLGEELVSPFAIGFFGTLLDLLAIVRGSATREQLLPIVSWQEGGRTQRIAIV